MVFSCHCTNGQCVSNSHFNPASCPIYVKAKGMICEPCKKQVLNNLRMDRAMLDWLDNIRFSEPCDGHVSCQDEDPQAASSSLVQEPMLIHRLWIQLPGQTLANWPWSAWHRGTATNSGFGCTALCTSPFLGFRHGLVAWRCVIWAASCLQERWPPYLPQVLRFSLSRTSWFSGSFVAMVVFMLTWTYSESQRPWTCMLTMFTCVWSPTTHRKFQASPTLGQGKGPHLQSWPCPSWAL